MGQKIFQTYSHISRSEKLYQYVAFHPLYRENQFSISTFIESRPNNLLLVPKQVQNGKKTFRKYSHLCCSEKPKNLFLVPKQVPNRFKRAKKYSKHILIFLAAKNCTSMLRFIHFVMKISSQFQCLWKIGRKPYFWYQNRSQIGPKWPTNIMKIFSSFSQ